MAWIYRDKNGDLMFSKIKPKKFIFSDLKIMKFIKNQKVHGLRFWTTTIL